MSRGGPMNNPIPVGAHLDVEIERLRKERNAVILAHYYQEDDIQDMADFIGDSLQWPKLLEIPLLM